FKVLDPAVGSGAFCSQLIRLLWKGASRKWKLQDERKFRFDVCSKVIYFADIDSEALKLAKVVLWVSAGCPESGIDLNLANCDSLGVGSCENTKLWNKHTGFDVQSGFDVVFGNPPYVRVKPETLQGFTMASTRNLYCAFTELGLNLLNDDGLLCYIVPQSIVASKETLPLRQRLIDERSSLSLQIFDSVPDFLFDQGKIESNTNTNINQRTAILLLDRNQENSIYSSPLLRWRRGEERDDLFKNLSQIQITKNDIHNGAIPMLENKQDLELFRKLKLQKKTISDTIIKEGGRVLFIPKAIRYFISAVPFDLERPNTIQLRVSEDYFHLIHSTLNSNLFYWWWRVNGNGFQVEINDILSFPLLEMNGKIAADFSKKLDDAVDDCRVFKQNAGKQIPNINYNYRQDLLQEIDKALLETINMKPHERVFGCKTNSLFGKMDALRGYNSN
ncbi:MAG: Eco57I restriction-modification methylase domain-containing protein, partial [archaeon]|nr:Eco57I restriction-modification methylase domain-containing protein [archaeon]